jgi:DNA polymerase elongation subunit (family B)
VLLAWGPGRKVNIPHENIIRERAVICIAWKWEGQQRTYCRTWDGRQNDKALLAEFVEVMHSADEIVAHNADRFDTPWIRTRCLYHNIPMSPEFVSLDTLKAARSGFRFNSNRLDYLARFLLKDQKQHAGFDLWRRILLDKDEAALRKMVEYCKHDVRLLEQVYERLAPFIKAKTHRGAHRSLSACPECESRNTQINKRRVTAAGHWRVQYRCNDCGKYHSIAETRYLKAKEEAG